MDGIKKVYAGGVMDGTSNSTFSPSANYTIQQAIVTMVRLYEYATK